MVTNWLVQKESICQILRDYIWYVLMYSISMAAKGARWAICPRASGSRGPHKLILPLLWFIIHGSKYTQNQNPLDSLAFCPFCLPKAQGGPHLAVLPLGLENLSAALFNSNLYFKAKGKFLKITHQSSLLWW